MKLLKKLIGIFFIGTIVLFAPGFLSIESAHAAAPLGGIDINGYCNHTYTGTIFFPVATYSRSILLPPGDAYSWRCIVHTAYGLSNGKILTGSYYRNVDLNSACQWEYGAGTYAKVDRYSDPYSWHCYR